MNVIVDGKNDKIQIRHASERCNMMDFFRGVAIFMVFLTHSHQMFDVPKWLFNVLNFLQLGCQIFFVLSALGLCISYSRRSISWIEFMKNRLSRLVIGYWFMILFYILYQVITSAIMGRNVLSSINFPGVIINMFFLNGLVPIDFINNHIVSSGWFVGTIVLLYAIFPLLFKIYNIENVKWRKVRCVLFPLVTFVISFALMNIVGVINPSFNLSNPFMYRFALNQLPCFAVGFSLYDLLQNKKHISVKNPLLFFAILFFAASVVLFYSGCVWSGAVYPVMFSLSFAFFYIFLNQKDGMKDFFTSGKNVFVKVFSTCGKLSFFIYMVQSIVLFYMIEPTLKFIMSHYGNEFVIYLVLLPIMAIICFIFAKILMKIDSVIQRRV